MSNENNGYTTLLAISADYDFCDFSPLFTVSEIAMIASFKKTRSQHCFCCNGRRTFGPPPVSSPKSPVSSDTARNGIGELVDLQTKEARDTLFSR
jgi:hypothetical protein